MLYTTLCCKLMEVVGACLCVGAVTMPFTTWVMQEVARVWGLGLVVRVLRMGYEASKGKGVGRGGVRHGVYLGVQPTSYGLKSARSLFRCSFTVTLLAPILLSTLVKARHLPRRAFGRERNPSA